MEYRSACLLIADDNENNRYTLRRRLEKEGFTHLVEVADGQSALAYIEEHLVDLLFLDLMMPGMDGFAVLEHLKEHKKLHSLPVIIISADERIENIVRGIELGATDYLAKPFNTALLRARVMASLEQKHLREVETAFLELFDSETKLPNRKHFLDLANAQCLQLSEQRHMVQRASAIFVVSIKAMQDVGSSWGAEEASNLMRLVASMLQKELKESRLFARVGATAFAIFVKEIRDERAVFSLAQKMKEMLDKPLEVGSNMIVPGCYIGIAVDVGGCRAAEGLLSDAELATARAREERKKTIYLFDQQMQKTAENKIALQTELMRAIEKNELTLFYQPLVSLETGKIVGAEALVRWQNPERGLVSPMDFIPLAEETGQILKIGAWVIEEGVRQAALWQNKFGAQRDFVINVNVSARQFVEQNIAEDFAAAFQKYGYAPMKVEITESAVMYDTAETKRMLDDLAALSVSRAIDDFGTGYSSLGNLQSFSFDTLKMDKAFIDRLHDDKTSRSIIRAVIMMAHAMGMTVVAEGIEVKEHLDLLRTWGCNYAQGFYMAKPMPADALEKLMAEDRSW